MYAIAGCVRESHDFEVEINEDGCMEYKEGCGAVTAKGQKDLLSQSSWL